jgi:phosphatidylinositol transfer protein SFH5
MSAEPEPVAEVVTVLAKDTVTELPKEVVKEVQSTPAAPQATDASAPAGKDVKAPRETVLSKLLKELPWIIDHAQYNEMWGVTLTDESHVPTTIVLEKFLRANLNDFSKAKAQLIQALKWRKTMQPVKLLADTEYDSAKFGGLGYVTTYQRADGKGKEIITWNIYGAVKDTKATFGDVQECVGSHTDP